MGEIYLGNIKDVLSAGEYDQGDRVLIYYDDLYDLYNLQLLKKNCPCCSYPNCGHDHSADPKWKPKIGSITKDESVTWTNIGSPEGSEDKDLHIFGITPEMAADFFVWSILTFVFSVFVNLSIGKYRWPWLNVVILSLVAGYGYYKGRNKGEKS